MLASLLSNRKTSSSLAGLLVKNAFNSRNMSSSTVVVSCEGSATEFAIISSAVDINSACGLLLNGSVASLLRISTTFKESLTNESFTALLQTILQDKGAFFARVDKASKSLSVCKYVDEITIKVVQFDIVEISGSKSTSTALETEYSKKFALALEAQVSEAHAVITSQSAELAELRQHCEQLLDKYTAAAAEKAVMRDNLLAGFCRILNSKKARIRQLASGGGSGDIKGTDSDDGSVTDNAESKTAASAPHGGKIKAASGGVKKRKSPSLSTPAATSKKPPVRRTRSNAKVDDD